MIVLRCSAKQTRPSRQKKRDGNEMLPSREIFQTSALFI